MMFSSILRRMAERTEDRPSPHIFTIKDTPRLPRALFDQFRTVATSRGDSTIDALRRALELYIAQEQKP